MGESHGCGIRVEERKGKITFDSGDARARAADAITLARDRLGGGVRLADESELASNWKKARPGV